MVVRILQAIIIVILPHWRRDFIFQIREMMDIAVKDIAIPIHPHPITIVVHLHHVVMTIVAAVRMSIMVGILRKIIRSILADVIVVE